MRINKVLLIVATLIQTLCVSAQQSDILTNTKVIQLVKAGFGEQIVVAKINSSLCSFNLELDSMIVLKNHGITDGMIAAMMSARQISIVDMNSDNPLDMHRSGIYYYDSLAPSGEMVRGIDENVISQTKASGAYVYGIPVSSSSIVVDGVQARFVIKNIYPDFFFYFEPNKTTNSLNESGFENYNATSPNQFSVIVFSSSSSSNQRSVQTSSGIGISAASGIGSKYKIPFEYEKLSDGVYRVYFKTQLKPGEYAFIYSGANGYNNKIFDFSIFDENDKSKKSKGGGVGDFLFH